MTLLWDTVCRDEHNLVIGKQVLTNINVCLWDDCADATENTSSSLKTTKQYNTSMKLVILQIIPLKEFQGLQSVCVITIQNNLDQKEVIPLPMNSSKATASNANEYVNLISTKKL